jgi:hypothetical protein
VELKFVALVDGVTAKQHVKGVHIYVCLLKIFVIQDVHLHSQQQHGRLSYIFVLKINAHACMNVKIISGNYCQKILHKTADAQTPVLQKDPLLKQKLLFLHLLKQKMAFSI